MPNRISQLKIDTTSPGFYDDPKFVEAERSDPSLLEAYAEFVRGRAFGHEYAAAARVQVESVTSFLSDRLRRDGRKGACIDMSCTVSRFLERLGVWNYIVIGSVTIEFPSDSKLKPRHFWSIGSGPSAQGARAAHAWVCAPPYSIIDLTLAMQPYTSGEENYLPKCVTEEHAIKATAIFSDIVDPEARASVRRVLGREPTISDLERLSAGLPERVRTLGAFEIYHNSTKVRYVACGVSAPDAPMELAENIRLSGKRMIELWQDFCAARAHNAASQSQSSNKEGLPK